MEDVAEGRYVVAADLGVMRIAEGHDGRVHWRQDPSGGVHSLNAAFSQAASLTDAWLTRRGWLRADAGSARIGPAETRTRDGSRFVVLEATPPHGQPVEMWFDASTFLLERTVRTMPISIQTVRYSDYGRVSGIALPYTIETSDSSAPTKDIVRIDRWEPRKRTTNATFAAPAPPDDTTLDGETTLPLDIEGFVIVGARLNGRDFDFILDTGGHDIITPEVAKLLDLQPVGEGASGGSGSGTLTEQYVRIDRLELGTATLRDQHFYVLPLQYSTVERGTKPPLAGILGLELFERLAVRIDYPGARLTLRKLNGFQHTTGGMPVPIVFDDDQPLLQGTINGVSGLIGLDTGNASTLVVQPVWARANGLADTLKRGIETVSYGSGGSSSNWVSRVHSVEVGSVEGGRPGALAEPAAETGIPARYLAAPLVRGPDLPS
jgi:predicted aspartyl protease